MWNGLNYLNKICDDTSFLSQYDQVKSWLGFSLTTNPLLVPPEILSEVLSIYYCRKDEIYILIIFHRNQIYLQMHTSSLVELLSYLIPLLAN